MKSRITFFTEEIDFNLKNKNTIRNWLTCVIEEEKHRPLDINYIFCSDDFLFQLNKNYLNHRTLTDIITFPDILSGPKKSGDIYISIDRIRENAEKYDQSFTRELYRVMVHGALHLLGYQDKSIKDKGVMTTKEDYYLDKIKIR